MRKVYLLTLIGLLFSSFVFSADKTWIGAVGANWSTSTNWSPTGTPGSSDRALFTSNATVVIDAAVNIGGISVTGSSTVILQALASRNITFFEDGTPYNGLDVETGSTLFLRVTGGTSVNFNLISGTGAKANIAGTLKFDGVNSNNSAKADFTGGNWTFTSGSYYIADVNSGNPVGGSATVNFAAGSTFVMNDVGGSVPQGTWDAASTIEVTGSTSSSISVWSPSQIGNLTYNCPGQTSNIGLALPTNFTIQGNLKVLNTGAFRLALASNPNNITINGNMEVAATRVCFSAGSTANAVGVTINGNLIVTSGTVDMQESSANTIVRLRGNLVMSAGTTLTETGSATGTDLQLNGTSAQTLTFGNLTNDLRITINNAAGVTATNNWVMPNSTNSRILLTLGNISLGSNLLHIQSPSALALTGGSISSHVIGRVRRETNSNSTYIFPVSKSASEVASIKINPAGTTATSYEVEFFRPNAYDRFAQADATVKNAGDYYWDITRPSGTENADVTIRYVDMATGNSNAEADLRVLHWNGTAWDNFGGTGASGEVTATGVSTFSPFSLGTVGLTPLPVRLVSFSGLRQNNINKLTWTVEAEQGNKGFYVERSADGRSFTSLGFVASRAQGGNSNSQITYTFNDNSITGDRHYYRLRQVDLDGKEKTSNIVLIKGTRVAGLTIGGYFPNPVVSKLNVIVEAPAKDQIVLQIVDITGKLIKEQRALVEAGSNTIELDVQPIASGTYVLRLTNKATGESSTAKFVK